MADEERHSKKYKIEGTNQYFYSDANTFPGKDSITKDELEAYAKERQETAMAKVEKMKADYEAEAKEDAAQRIAKNEGMPIEDARARVEREWDTGKSEPDAPKADNGYHSLFGDTSKDNAIKTPAQGGEAALFKVDAQKESAASLIREPEIPDAQKGSGLPSQMNVLNSTAKSSDISGRAIPNIPSSTFTPAKSAASPLQNATISTGISSQSGIGIAAGIAPSASAYGKATAATAMKAPTHTPATANVSEAGNLSQISTSGTKIKSGASGAAAAVAGQITNTAINAAKRTGQSIAGDSAGGAQISDSVASQTAGRAKGAMSTVTGIVQDTVHKAGDGVRRITVAHADTVAPNIPKDSSLKKAEPKGSVKPAGKTDKPGKSKPDGKDKVDSKSKVKAGKPSVKDQGKSGLAMEGGMIKQRGVKKAGPDKKGVHVAGGAPVNEKTVKKPGGTTKIGKDKPGADKVNSTGKNSDKLKHVSDNAKKKNSSEKVTKVENKKAGKKKPKTTDKKELEKKQKKGFAKKNNNAKKTAKGAKQTAGKAAGKAGKEAAKGAADSAVPVGLIIKIVLACILVMFFMLDIVIIALSGGSGGISMPLQDVKTVIQPTIDDLYQLEKAYMENLVHYGENPDYDYAGIPDTWCLSDSDGHDFSGVEHYSGSKRVGYDLLKYHANVTYISESTVTAYKTETQTRATGSTVPGSDGKPIPEFVSFTTIVPYSATATLTAPGDFNGDFGTFNALNATSSAIGDDSTVDISYSFYGSPSMNEYSDSKASSFIDGDGNTVNYDNGVLFKNIISMASAFCGDENEDYEFYHAYCKSLFNAVMDKATITIVAKDSEDENRTVTWTYHDDLGNADSACRTKGVKTIVSVNIRINDCGIQDLMALDPVTDEWAHDTANGGSKHYKVTDFENPKYIKWEGWKDDAKNLTGSAEMAIIYASISDNDWAKLSGKNGVGVQFPGGIVGSLTASQITDIISEISNTQALSDKQEGILRVGLGYVGACPYLWGGGNINSGIDCSHFVCLILGESGTTMPYPINYGTTDTLEKCYKDELFWHSMNKSNIEDWKKLPVGTVLVKGNGASAQAHTNHTVIYAGVFTAPGETEPAPHFIESTNSRGASGPQIGNRSLSYYAGYEYARNPF